MRKLLDTKQTRRMYETEPDVFELEEMRERRHNKFYSDRDDNADGFYEEAFDCVMNLYDEILDVEDDTEVDECYCKRETCLRAPMEYYEDLIQKVKDLGNAIRECGDDAPPEMIGVQDRFIRMITGNMTDRQHNFVKWLNGEPCVFVHPLTGNLIEVRIGNDYEAIIRFLEYCWKLQCGIEIDDDELAYLAYIIARSNSNGEEC